MITAPPAQPNGYFFLPFWPFFANYVLIFQKTVIQTVFLRIGLKVKTQNANKEKKIPLKILKKVTNKIDSFKSSNVLTFYITNSVSFNEDFQILMTEKPCPK